MLKDIRQSIYLVTWMKSLNIFDKICLNGRKYYGQTLYKYIICEFLKEDQLYNAQKKVCNSKDALFK